MCLNQRRPLIHYFGKLKPRHQQSESPRELFDTLEYSKIKETSILISVGTCVRSSMQNATHYRKVIQCTCFQRKLHSIKAIHLLLLVVDLEAYRDKGLGALVLSHS